MRKEGVIVSLEDGKAKVSFTRESSCGSCRACGGRTCEAVAETEIPVVIGDRVAVEMPDKGVLRLSVITYGVPLLALILGLSSGYLIWRALNVTMNADLFIAIITGVFLLLGFYVLHVLQGKRGFQPNFHARITEVLDNDS